MQAVDQSGVGVMFPIFTTVMAVAFTALTVWGVVRIVQFSRDGRDWFLDTNPLWTIGSIISGLAALALIALIVTTPIIAKRESANCQRWGEQVERQVKFVRWTYWSFDCVTLTDEGWVSRDAVVKVDD